MAVYGIASDGNLWWYSHDGRGDGTERWTGRNLVGRGGWQDYKSVFGARDGILYAISHDGNLWWYHHTDWANGTEAWTGRNLVGRGGWDDYKTVFAGIEGTIYGVSHDGNLWWYRHDGRTAGTEGWTGRRLVGRGGWQDYRTVFAGSGGAIYAISNDGNLWWYRHDGWHDGSESWSGRNLIGRGGWADYKSVLAGRGNDIYAVANDGDLWWYRHDGALDGTERWTGRNRVGRGGWQDYKGVTVVGDQVADNFTFVAGITQAQQDTVLERHRFAYSRIMQCQNITGQRIALINAYNRPIQHGIETQPNVNASAIVGGTQMWVNFNVLFPQGPVEIAQTLIHEMMHCAGFRHPQRRVPPAGMSCANPNPNLFDCPFDNGQYYGTPPLQAEVCIAGSQSDVLRLLDAQAEEYCVIDEEGKATISRAPRQ